MVVDLIGIYGLKGPYCTLTTTDWFLQALSVIPRGSWGDVARRFTMIRWAVLVDSRLPSSLHKPPRVAGIRSGRFDEENPFVQNSSVLLVQPDEGVSVLVVDRICDYLPQSTEKSRVLVIPVGARHKCQQENSGRYTHGRRSCFVILLPINYSFQKWYKMKHLHERSPTLPQSFKQRPETTGINGEKLR
ncbi:hypothetical protein F511_33655 [Dorcoceras hygrometricum]|uniref:Uncharacterized protein n=1 Tax=Dorcoceras hygrometricum TaxID=472368 RepID=A0A2Z7C789_9LAMI|nr:hypothetical protein F511_33655 [Dorcoceras hygrometricum]